MRSLVADEALIGTAAPPGWFTAIPRSPGRRWRRDTSGNVDAVVAAVEAAGPGAIVLARPPEGDGGGGAASAVARMMGAEVVRLPAGAAAAAWTVGVALRALDDDDDGLVRRLQGLASLCAAGLPVTSSLRPAVLLRYAGWAWRPCRACDGGGVEAGPCGRCGAPIEVAS